MSKRSLREMVNDPRWIAGIYNYCDRWCERCPLSSRCMQFARLREERAPENFDELAVRVREDFAEAMAMLQEKADELGIDLSPPDPDETAKSRAVRETLDEHPVRQAAGDYTRRADAWLRKHDEAGAAHGQPAPAGDARPREGAKPFLSEHEAMTIIAQYHLLIAGKVARALAFEPFDEEDAQSVQNDGNGSARVALLAIDRSMDAWFELLHYRRDTGDIEGMLERLNTIREDVERLFPYARRFVRPGFDTGDRPWVEEPR